MVDNQKAMNKIKSSLLNKQEQQLIPGKSRNPRNTISLTQQDRDTKSQKSGNDLLDIGGSGTYNPNTQSKKMMFVTKKQNMLVSPTSASQRVRVLFAQ